jgi:hypothetical protein
LTTATLEIESVVDRYYDPATDQFLSVDPDVAQTGQPYAFTGDDPLNASDPLGLSKGGNQNVRSNEFEGYSDEELVALYDSLSNARTKADKALRSKVYTELKGRGVKGSGGGGGVIKSVSVTPSAEMNQAPLLMTAAQFAQVTRAIAVFGAAAFLAFVVKVVSDVAKYGKYAGDAG